MKLLGNRALIAPLPQAKTTDSGLLFLTDKYSSENQNHVLYRVLAIGPGRRLKSGVTVPPDFRPGDRVVCHSFMGNQHTFEDGRRIVDASEIMLVL